MRAVLHILELAGSYREELYLRIENPPHPLLVIEAMSEPGPRGLPCLSVAHYGEKIGDLIGDPEMMLEVVEKPSGLSLDPYYWRDDRLGVEQYSRTRRGEEYSVLQELYAQHLGFALGWDRAIAMHGYAGAFLGKRRQPLTIP